jgi:CHAT domain-containing protein
VRQLNVRNGDLESAWRWLKFELFAPLADRKSDPKLAITALENIRSLIGLSFEKSCTTLSPEGQFWQIPWSAIAALNNGSEAVLSSGPWSANCKESLPHDPRSVIWYQSHPGLPLIDQEVDNFMTSFPGSRVCRTVTEVRACLADGPVDLLHVASHASFHRENPMFSAFSFESGKVTAAEIARSSFRPGIVVLSACETGMVSTQRPAEPEGFARAFLARGATSVITSFWPLDDQAACVFSQILYSNLKLGRSVVDSTAAARSGVRSKMGHPYFWGPFTLFGGYVS